jgi:hypothetical protein
VFYALKITSLLLCEVVMKIRLAELVMDVMDVNFVINFSFLEILCVGME